MKASQWESERSALKQQNRALVLKTESEHKTVVILVISFGGIENFMNAMQQYMDAYYSALDTIQIILS